MQVKITKIKDDKKVLINLRVLPSEKAALEQVARKYADGNLSLWLRHAGRNHIPRKSDHRIA